MALSLTRRRRRLTLAEDRFDGPTSLNCRRKLSGYRHQWLLHPPINSLGNCGARANRFMEMKILHKDEVGLRLE
jgi:hypothetical protein